MPRAAPKHSAQTMSAIAQDTSHRRKKSCVPPKVQSITAAVSGIQRTRHSTRPRRLVFGPKNAERREIFDFKNRPQMVDGSFPWSRGRHAPAPSKEVNSLEPPARERDF